MVQHVQSVPLSACIIAIESRPIAEGFLISCTKNHSADDKKKNRKKIQELPRCRLSNCFHLANFETVSDRSVITIKERKLALRLSPMSTLTLILPLEDEARLKISDTMMKYAAVETSTVGVQGTRHGKKSVIFTLDFMHSVPVAAELVHLKIRLKKRRHSSCILLVK